MQVTAREQSGNCKSNRCNPTAELRLQQFLTHSSRHTNLCQLLQSFYTSFRAADEEMQIYFFRLKKNDFFM